MKKTIASLAFVCYLAVTSGVIVNFHYCMNRLAATQLFAAKNEVCPTCGMKIKKEHGCCRDEVMIVKMEVDQKSTPNFVFELPAIDAFGQVPSQFIAASFTNIDEKRHFHNHSPPLLTDRDRYLQNCVFRI
jgi:hypothetical protein